MYRPYPRIFPVTVFAVAAFSPGEANATLISAEPDDFPAGTDIRTVFPGVLLSVNGQPSVPVLSALGDFRGGCGGPCASTGTQVFNYPDSDPARWQFGIAEFRADFDSPTDFVSIDFVGVDDGDVQLIAYDSNNTQLDIFRVHLGAAGHNVTGSISRSSADIAYILAGGVPGEGTLLDNLKYNLEDAAERLGCEGFAPPMDQDAVKVEPKQPRQVLPLLAELHRLVLKRTISMLQAEFQAS